MFKIGCHLSSSKGFTNMGMQILDLEGNTFQFFTRNPRGGKVKKIDDSDINNFLKLKEKYNISEIVAHSPYTINLCSHNPKIRGFSRDTMIDDLKIMENIPNSFYNFHPGSHTGQGSEIAINQIADALNKILSENQKTIVLLETMAGKGTEVGKNFEELKKIIDRIILKDKIGVCFDTCHTFDSGYDIVNNLRGVLDEFDSIIGIDYLKVVHLNDSKNFLGSRKDRHEKIGQGKIGVDAIKNIINDKYLKKLPFILETPHDTLDGYKYEIRLLKTLRCRSV